MFKLKTKFCNSPYLHFVSSSEVPSTMCIYTSNIPKLCLYKMKHGDHFCEPKRKRNKIYASIKYLLKRDVV